MAKIEECYEFKNWSSEELVAYISDFVNELFELKVDINNFLKKDRNIRHHEETLRNRYKILKEKMEHLYQYTHKSKNRNSGNNFYDFVFCNYISRAGAKGFISKSNARVDGKMYSSVSDAEFYLRLIITKQN